ncbi:hypothetical protein GCM10028778_20810 [Barrientosiimonas marina]|uniref:DUF5839 family protein n=1 Tax=Lentibacillus kimchii TaxID=1542911 RepID=A0ABW2UXL6_9BACI
MDERNVIAGYHIISYENGVMNLNMKKLYYWHIHKRFRLDDKTPIQKGDIVIVMTARGRRKVLVMDVLREDNTGDKKKYKQVKKIVERAPESSSQNQDSSSS